MQAVAIQQAEDTELLEAAAIEKANYEQLKSDLQFWTLAVSLFGVTAGWLVYSQVCSLMAHLQTLT